MCFVSGFAYCIHLTLCLPMTLYMEYDRTYSQHILDLFGDGIQLGSARPWVGVQGGTGWYKESQ